ncbi:restriction endonuclease subunit S [Escherichia coli]
MSELSYLEKLLDGVEVGWKTLEDITLRTSNIKWREAIRSYRYIDLTSVDIATKKIIETTEITKNNAPSRAQKLVDENDVIFATTRPTQQRFCLIDSEYAGEVASTGYCILRAKKDQVLPKWILHWISTSDFKKHVEENQSGSAYPAISDSKVKECLIPIPCPDNPEKSLAIQSEIVRILDTFSALTAELTAELNMRKKQYNYYRDQLLSFKEGEVEWKTLGEIGKWYGGGTPSKNKIEFWENGSIPWISPKDMGRTLVDSSEDYITEEAVLQSSTKLIPANSIAIVVRSSILDKVLPSALIKVPATLNQDMKAVIPHENILVKYIYHMIGSRGSDILRAAKKTGGSVASIDSKKLFSFKIPVPNINEQQRIVEILDKFDTLTNSITEGLPREIELRQKQYEYYRDLLFSFPKPETVSN